MEKENVDDAFQIFVCKKKHGLKKAKELESKD